MTFIPRLHDYRASGNCLKVRATMRLLGLPFERVPVDIFAGDTLTDAYAAINPVRTTPVLEIRPERHLAESNAILLHVAEGTELLPSDAADRSDVHRWLFFERAFTPAVGGVRFMRLTGRDALAPEAVRTGVGTGTRLLRIMDEHLTTRPFLASDRLTVADLSLWSYAHVAHEGGFAVDALDGLRGWVERVGATPGFENDLEPYPANARAGTSRSIYD
jgi:glutathione S-transferase